MNNNNKIFENLKFDYYYFFFFENKAMARMKDKLSNLEELKQELNSTQVCFIFCYYFN